MKDYKILASDLDGTFLQPNREVSAENWDAVKTLSEKGVFFVPCTGRTLGEMDAEIRDNPLVRYIIHSDGAVVYDKLTDQRITMCMPRDAGHRLLDILFDYDAFYVTRHNKIAYVDSGFHNPEGHARCNVDSYYSEVLLQYGVPRDHFKNFCYSLDEIEMINGFFRTDEDRVSCMERILGTGEFLVAPAKQYMEIFHVSAGKGNALLRLAEELGLDRSQTIGVGDSTNDMTLLKRAGLGLAMANACDALKAEADAIICSNREHAIQYILEHYVK